MSSPVFQSIPGNELGGTAVVTVFAVLATLSLFFIIARAICIAVVSKRDPSQATRESAFLHTQLGLYAACLLFSDLLGSLAGMISIRWISEKGITRGPLCSAQAVVMQIATFSSAFFTVTIAVHTFITLVMRKRQSHYISTLVIVIGWASSLAIATLPMQQSNTSGPLYGAAGFTCGVRDVYPRQQFSLHLLPIFIASLLSAILYSLIFVVLRGTLVIKDGFKFNLSPEERWEDRAGKLEDYHRFLSAIARSMLWYPIAYIILLVPYSVTRLLDISGFAVPFYLIVFAFVFWFLLGLVNVVILYNTLRVLGPVFDARSGTNSTHKDLESFSSPDAAGPKPLTLSTRTSRLDPYYSKDKRIQQRNKPATITAPARVRSLTHHRSSSVASTNSSVNLLAHSQHGHSASMDSTYSSQSAASLQRSIYPVAEMESVSNEPVVQRPLPAQVDLSHKSSVASLLPLPAPPRSRSPLARRPTLETIPSPPRRFSGLWSPVDLRTPDPHSMEPSFPQDSYQTSIRVARTAARLTPITPLRLSITKSPDLSSGIIYQSPKGSMFRGSPRLASLSAVTSRRSFDDPQTPSSPSDYGSLPASTTRSRHYSRGDAGVAADYVDAGSISVPRARGPRA